MAPEGSERGSESLDYEDEQKYGLGHVMYPSFVLDVEGSSDCTDVDLPSDKISFLRDVEIPLGDASPPVIDPLARTCFNCGSSSHILSACPNPLNRTRIASARTSFTASPSNSTSHSFRRFHEVAQDQRVRIHYLDTFVAGRIVGRELRDALGLDDPNIGSEEKFRREDEAHWYNGMLKWGYPPGYYSEQDPREAVRVRILGSELGGDEDDGDDNSLLAIYTGPDDTGWQSADEDSDDEGSLTSSCSSHITTVTLSSSDHSYPLPPHTRIRWAPYPTTLFKWALLPIAHISHPLPPIINNPTPLPTSATFTEDRRALWQRIVTGVDPPEPPPPEVKVPPWRLSSMWQWGFESPRTKRAVMPPHVVKSPERRVVNHEESDEDVDMDLSD